LRRIEAAEANAIRRKPRALRLGHVQTGHSSQHLTRDVLGGVHVQAVEREHGGLLPRKDRAIEGIGHDAHRPGSRRTAGHTHFSESLRLGPKTDVQRDHAVADDPDGPPVRDESDRSDLERVFRRGEIIEPKLAGLIRGGVAVRFDEPNGGFDDGAVWPGYGASKSASSRGLGHQG
jgi:hypothetical protein